MIRSTLYVTKRTPWRPGAWWSPSIRSGAEVGAGILQRGGNAVDAAVATAFAMPVVEPFMSSLAGGGTMLVHLAKRGETVCVDFNVRRPRRPTRRCFELGEGVSTGPLPVAAGGGRRQRLRPALGGDAGLGGRADARARALGHHGPGRRLRARDRARRGRLRAGLVRGADHGRHLPGARRPFPRRRARTICATATTSTDAGLGAPATCCASPTSAGACGSSPRTARTAFYTRRDRPGHRRGDAASRAACSREDDLAGYAPRVLPASWASIAASSWPSRPARPAAPPRSRC